MNYNEEDDRPKRGAKYGENPGFEPQGPYVNFLQNGEKVKGQDRQKRSTTTYDARQEKAFKCSR